MGKSSTLVKNYPPKLRSTYEIQRFGDHVETELNGSGLVCLSICRVSWSHFTLEA